MTGCVQLMEGESSGESRDLLLVGRCASPFRSGIQLILMTCSALSNFSILELVSKAPGHVGFTQSVFDGRRVHIGSKWWTALAVHTATSPLSWHIMFYTSVIAHCTDQERTLDSSHVPGSHQSLSVLFKTQYCSNISTLWVPEIYTISCRGSEVEAMSKERQCLSYGFMYSEKGIVYAWRHCETYVQASCIVHVYVKRRYNCTDFIWLSLMCSSFKSWDNIGVN